jgi:hypothetical protein
MFHHCDASLGARQEEGEEQEGESCGHGGRLICAHSIRLVGVLFIFYQKFKDGVERKQRKNKTVVVEGYVTPLLETNCIDNQNDCFLLLVFIKSRRKIKLFGIIKMIERKLFRPNSCF